MKISELIEALEKQKQAHGDVRVTIDSMSHSFPPDPALRERGGEKVLVLNS